MKKLLLFALSAACLAACTQQPAALKAPVTKKGPKTFNEHGNTRTDDYYWLNNPKDTAVINHLNEENAYTEAYMKHTGDLQKKLYDEIVARIDQKEESFPVEKNGYWYYTRYEEGNQYPLYCRRQNLTDAKEQVCLDINTLAKGYKLYMTRGVAMSPNSNLLAYGIDTSGNRQSRLFIKNVADGSLAKEVISETAADYAWANDNKTLYYTLNDKTVRSYKVMRHTLGTPPATDEMVFTERDSTFSVGLKASANNRYIFITLFSSTSSESYYLDAGNPKAKAVLIQARAKDVLYYPAYYEGDSFFIRTNYKARNFKYVSAPISKPGTANWTDVIPRRADALLEKVEVVKNYFALQYRQKAATQIRVINRATQAGYQVPFKEDAYVASLSLATDNYNADSIRYNYTSLTTPGSVYRFDLGSRKTSLLKQEKVGGGYNAALYQTKRIWVKAQDGKTEVPVSIVYKKDLFKKDGSNPLLLYAYGSYGYSYDPEFEGPMISLLDRGFVYAIAHIRGGQEMGRYWYEDEGRLLHKKNTFTDYVDCAQYLVDNKYTSKEKLFANGASAGGMLMGVITNMRPDLFKGVLAEVPWMDVISDMMDASIPLTTLEYEEWGDPNKKVYYDYMLSWSPYDNVKKASYPAIFATGGLNDTQVPYYCPAKWVAKIRELNSSTNPVLFKCNMGAGHAGDSGRFQSQKLTALKYAFILDQLGITE